MRSKRQAAVVGLILLAAAPLPAFTQAVDSADGVRQVASVLDQVERTAALDREARLSVTNEPLLTALIMLQRSSGVELTYSPTLLPARRVNCDCGEISVREALAILLRDTRLDFREINGQIVIVPPVAPEPSMVHHVSAIQTEPPSGVPDPLEDIITVLPRQITGQIRGRVTDATNGRALSVANVVAEIDGVTRSAVTDERGSYVLTVPAGTVMLRAQHIGYAPQRRRVTVESGATVTADFELRHTAIEMEALVVTPTGQARRKEVAHTISVINTAELTVPPIKGVEEMLVANAPGVYVMANSGQPGGGGTIRIRGNNSVSQTNSPMIYVDGVRVYSDISPTHPNSNQGLLPINDINPADIDRIEIVKGSAATTLYGTEAAGGVIQIFTKRGGTGAPVWTAELTSGFHDPGHIGPREDPDGMWLNNCRGVKETALGISFQDPTCPASGSWVRRGAIQKYSLSVRGGLDQFGYYVSGNFNDERGVTWGAGTRHGGFRANFSFKPSDVVELSLNTGYTNRNTDWLREGDGLLRNVHRGPTGNFTGGTGCDPDVDVCLNNIEIFREESTSRAEHHVVGGTILLMPRPGIVSRLHVGLDNNDLAHEIFKPFGFYTDPDGEISWRSWQQKTITVDLATTFERDLGRDLSSASSFGAQVFDSRSFEAAVTGEGFHGPGRPTLSDAIFRSGGSSGHVRVVNAGIFLQQMLGWRDQLFVTGGLRVDGNSSFGTDYGLQTYPKLGLSYAFPEGRLPYWLGVLKLRGAVGESGKAPGPYDAAQTWSSTTGDGGLPAFTPGDRGNRTLGPERTREFEAGLDASIGGGRVEIDFTYYNQRTSDALVPVQYPPSEGFVRRQLENIGVLETKGTETRLQGLLLRTQNLEWTGRVDYSTVNSKALSLNDEVYTVQASAVSYVMEGLPVPAYVGRVILNPHEFADPVIQDDTFIGTSYPNRIIGASSRISLFDRIRAEALGEWRLGQHAVNRTGHQHAPRGVWYLCRDAQQRMLAAAAGDPGALDQVTALDRARCDLSGDLAAIDFWVEKADYFVLRNVSLTYNLPARTLPGGVRLASVTLSGRNLVRSTDFTGTDPEVTNMDNSPFARWNSHVFPPPSRTFVLTARAEF